MQYEIRGLLEEHQEDIVKTSAIMVVDNRYLRELPKKAMIDIAIEAASHHMLGYYNMWCLFKDQPHEDNAEKEIWDLVCENNELAAYTINQRIEEYNKKHQQEQELEDQRYDL